jgi:hypothetical protein
LHPLSDGHGSSCSQWGKEVKVEDDATEDDVMETDGRFEPEISARLFHRFVG